MMAQSDPPPQPVPQDEQRATFAPKLTREIARIDWTKDARAIGCLLRGLDPRPGAWTELKGVEIKLFNPKVSEQPSPGAPGEVVSTGGSLVIATGGGTIEIFEGQPAGEEGMSAKDRRLGARLEALAQVSREPRRRRRMRTPPSASRHAP